MSSFQKHYGSGQGPKQRPRPVEEIELTNERQNKYYSTQDYDGTIRKRLIDEYPEESDEQADSSGKEHLKGTSTKYTHTGIQSSTNKLIDRLHSTIQSCKMKCGTQTVIKKLQFSELDLKSPVQEPKEVQLEVRMDHMKPKNDLKKKLQEQRMINYGQELIADMMVPSRKVKAIDREMAKFYKQNRNVNLQYRRQKFIKIFTGSNFKSGGVNFQY